MKDITGKRFGQLTALRPNYKDPNTGWRWVFQCTCGNEIDAAPGYLSKRVQDGHNPSCGCDRKAPRRFAEHITNHPLYPYWARMVDACSNPKHPQFNECRAYKIKVCDAWRRSPETFIEDMAPHFDPTLSNPRFVRLIRHKDYEPGNVAWLTASEANLNQNRCFPVDTPIGRMSVTKAAKRFGVNKYALRRAIERGESLSPFFGEFSPKNPTTPRTERVLVPTVEGEFITLSEAARRSGLGRVTIYERMRRNWPIERLLEPVNPH